MSAVVLGIDGGGTRTRASLAQDGRVLAFVEAGSIKRLRVGAAMAEENLRTLLGEVYKQAGVDGAAACCVGVASSTMPGIREWIMAVLGELHVERSEVVGDEVIALDAAFKGGAGILQIAGTGTNCIGRAPDGQRESAGGWSSVLGDEGSGYWIGLHAVRRGLNAHDRDEPTRVLDEVRKAWGAKDLDELSNIGNGTPGPDFAALAPVVARLAEEGDAVAIGVLRQAAADLAGNVLLVREKLFRKHGLMEEVPLAWIGSILGKVGMVREELYARLREVAPRMPIHDGEVNAIEGALWRAERLAG